MTDNKQYIRLNIEEIMADDFGKYAKYIIQDRALPDIRDGLKPVQRRIIYAMNNLKLFHDQPHKKSARTVGEVIGKYHPHGDSSIYEAMVRMSQDWKNNLILIDMHGNNGSIDGDGAAAMRYTECRLSPFGELMVNSLDKNTVEFINNFDDSETEPTLLPTLLPNLLINGATGIAAGYATNIPPFNVMEVIDAVITRIDSPNCHLKSILNVMPGPDFPTGGIILNPNGIIDAYTKGKGKITLRGKIVELNKKQLAIISIPYDTNKASIIRQIDLLKDKYDALKINEVRDESDKNGVNIVLDVHNTSNIELIKNLIYKETQLQVNYNINFVAIHGNKPVQFSIFDALDAFINHANHVVISSSKFDLDKAIKRKEIVEGLIKAVNIIDDVIYLVRHSNNKEEAKNKIVEQLAFTINQAEAIVNLRLYRLTNYDVNSLTEELNSLNESINQLNLLINDKTIRDNYIKSTLRGFKKQFNRPRLSEIINESGSISIDNSDTIEDKEVIVNITRDGYLKSFTKQTMGSIEYETIKVKDGDLPIALFMSNQKHKTVLITSKGNCISFPTYKIEQKKWKDIGDHINSITNISPDEKIVHAFNFPNNVEDPRCLLLTTKLGKIKKVKITSLNITNTVKSTNCMSLDDNDVIISCIVLANENTNQQIALIKNTGYGYICHLNEISTLGKTASGVKAMNLADNEIVAGVSLVDDKATLLIATDNGMKRIHFTELPINKRPSNGKSLLSIPKASPVNILGIFNCYSNSLIQIVNENNELSFLKGSEIVITDKDARVSKIKIWQIKDVCLHEYIDTVNGINEHHDEDIIANTSEIKINNETDEKDEETSQQMSIFDNE